MEIAEIGTEAAERVDSICRAIIEGGNLPALRNETLIVGALVVGTLQGYLMQVVWTNAGLDARKLHGNDERAIDDAMARSERNFDEIIKNARLSYQRRAFEASAVREDDNAAKTA
jgi:hypothetical protein